VPLRGRGGSLPAILESDPAELAGLRAQLGGWLRRSKLEESEIEPIILATNEAVANAIEHGRRGQHRVGVDAWTSPSSLTVEVRDRGVWRDEQRARSRPRAVADPRLHGHDHDRTVQRRDHGANAARDRARSRRGLVDLRGVDGASAVT
jgi:hypothetical protein